MLKFLINQMVRMITILPILGNIQYIIEKEGKNMIYIAVWLKAITQIHL
jgi:hypothetical protein